MASKNTPAPRTTVQQGTVVKVNRAPEQACTIDFQLFFVICYLFLKSLVTLFLLHRSQSRIKQKSDHGTYTCDPE